MVGPPHANKSIVVTYRVDYEHTGNGNTLKKVISTFEMFPSHFGKSSETLSGIFFFFPLMELEESKMVTGSGPNYYRKMPSKIF